MLKQLKLAHSSNLRPFILFFRQQGIAWQPVAEKYQMPESVVVGDSWLPADNVMRFVSDMVVSHALWRFDDFSHLITLDIIAPDLFQQVVKCGSFPEAVTTLTLLMPNLSNHAVMWPQKLDGAWYLCHRGSFHKKAKGYSHAEWFRTLAIISFCRVFLGNDWLPEQVMLSMGKRAANQNTPSFLSGVELSLDQSHGAIAIPLPSDFVPLMSFSPSEDGFQNYMNLIQTYAPFPWFNIQWLASVTSTSARTLQREFSQRGTHFRVLRGQVRCSKAKQMLLDGHQPADVAWHCGYSDLSNFNRAFKQWLGCTPAQLQRGLVNEG